MNQDSVLRRIESFNRERDPKRVSLKYQAMQGDIFAFFRGTAHLFYQDWPKNAPLNDAPRTWVCGDLHLENFGSYKGDNRLSYFDINDFDEAALAPCTWDLARYLCSLFVAAQSLGIEGPQVLQLCSSFLDAYYRELSEGKARWIERSTATGIIQDLLENLRLRSRTEFIHKRTFKQQGKRLLKIDDTKAMAARAEEKLRVKAMIDSSAISQAQPEFFQVLDVARRIAGTSSLGLERYIILINGKGHKRHYLLDMKYQPGSSLTPYLKVPQPAWRNEAERVVVLQHRGQAIAPAYLSAISDGNRSYLLKELMPQEDRLNLKHWDGKLLRLQAVVDAMAELVAWQHLRTGGWKGSAIADQWQDFGRQKVWKQLLIEYAQSYSQQVQSDWQSFKADTVKSFRGNSA
jgi:uncharacterized protein (DUF2252 family)